MRTTVDIDDDVLKAARQAARLSGQSLGRVLSDLARRGLQPSELRVEERQGIPVLVHREKPLPVTPDLVREILESTE